jgi:PIN domain nuclease of toxin-antitoxin system
MKYLLDTNIFVFLITKDLNRLSLSQKVVLSDPNNEFVISEASFYELGIKVRLEKPDFAHINIQTIDTEKRTE